jgi:hypothetical protein
MNLLIKSGLLGHFWTRNLIKNLRVLTEEKLDEIGGSSEHTPQKSLRRLAQGTDISKSSAFKAVNFNLFKWYRERKRETVCVCMCTGI